MKDFPHIQGASPHEGKTSVMTHYFQKMIKGQKKSELILYIVLWVLLFVLPVISMLVGDFFTGSSKWEARGMMDPDSLSYDWIGVFTAWSLLSMFCTTFFIHNFFITPLLVYCNRKWLYGIGVSILIVSFTLFQLYGRHHRPKPMGERDKQRMERMDTRPMRMAKPTNQTRPYTKHSPKDYEHEPPLIFGGQDSVAFIIMALLLGLNVGTKYFFKSLDDRKRMKELERENLTNQLAFLKYQINPHFFMNTLNNIHALVLIDPEKANCMIETLSKLMRYVLYDGNRSLAPLQKEMAFIENYVELMRVRYTDNVRIRIEMPEKVPDISVPSLLFATFIENAFKHMSYENKSFIEIGINADANSGVCFTCRNSRLPERADSHGGVGLANARKRLQLIYGNRYTLDITPSKQEYYVKLKLPARNKM